MDNQKITLDRKADRQKWGRLEENEGEEVGDGER